MTFGTKEEGGGVLDFRSERRRCTGSWRTWWAGAASSSLLPEAGSLSESPGQERGKGQRFFLSLSFLNKQLNINIPKSSFGGAGLGSLHR